jgi:hypothetical protein
MFECLAKYVIAQPEEKIGEISLEDLALCTAWYNSFDNQPEMTEEYAGFPDVLDHWISNVTQPTNETEGFRQQPLLRALLRKIEISGIDKLSPCGIEFLFFATGLMQRTPNKHLFERPIKCITPHNESLSKRRNLCRGEPGLPSLEEHITILGIGELMAAKPREIKTLAGIPMTYRGPVSAHKGDVKILGDRLKDRYVKIMQRNVENRISRGAGYRLTIMEIEGRIPTPPPQPPSRRMGK